MFSAGDHGESRRYSSCFCGSALYLGWLEVVDETEVPTTRSRGRSGFPLVGLLGQLAVLAGAMGGSNLACISLLFGTFDEMERIRPVLKHGPRSLHMCECRGGKPVARNESEGGFSPLR